MIDHIFVFFASNVLAGFVPTRYLVPGIYASWGCAFDFVDSVKRLCVRFSRFGERLLVGGNLSQLRFSLCCTVLCYTLLYSTLLGSTLVHVFSVIIYPTALYRTVLYFFSVCSVYTNIG